VSRPVTTFSEEPATDDFHTVVPSTGASAFHLLNYWQNTPAELKHFASVALKLVGFLSTSASVERAFSVARSVATDCQMTMTQETVSARVMIQANWRVARSLLANVLAIGRAGWSQTYREFEQRKLTQYPPWRLDTTREMEAAQAPSEEETERIPVEDLA
jgi:hypothetical protein